MLAILGLVEVLSELIHTLDSEDSAKRVDDTSWLDFITCEVVVSNKVLAWLLHCEVDRQLLSLEHNGEGVSSIISMVHFSNFHSVVCQVVVHNVGQVIALSVESKHFPVIVQELFL